ncbi:c-type cytochrome [Effusibacillus lacus]|nr:cytochrome c [Effusibacillus lacus]TCS70088.1 mono/diheme cytochrome c family protein [Effusibacillus lacus]
MVQEQNRTPKDREHIEPHDDLGYETVSGIKMGHAKVPKFLKATYIILAGWAVYYGITATTVNDRTDAVGPIEVTAEAGKEIFNASCAGCHAITNQRLVGPGLAGVYERLGDEELNNVLHNGRPQRGMPALPSLNLSEDQIKAVRLYLITLK